MNPLLRPIHGAALGALLLCAPRLIADPGAAAGQPAADPAGALARAGGRTDEALKRADLAAYRGWLKYLRLDAETEAGRSGVAGEAAVAKERRLEEWLARVSADPQVLASLRGVQEWAYESPVDGSGQPFRFVI